MAERTPDPVVLVLGKRAAAVQLVALLAQPGVDAAKAASAAPNSAPKMRHSHRGMNPATAAPPQVITESARIAVILRMQWINDLAVGPQRTRRPASDESVSC
jgi:hypothetical protein